MSPQRQDARRADRIEESIAYNGRWVRFYIQKGQPDQAAAYARIAGHAALQLAAVRESDEAKANTSTRTWR